MSSLVMLRHYVKQRLTSAAEEIFAAFEKTIVEYQEEISRQRQLLDRQDTPGRVIGDDVVARNNVLVKMEIFEEEDERQVMPCFERRHHREGKDKARSPREDAEATDGRFLTTETPVDDQLLLSSTNVQDPNTNKYGAQERVTRLEDDDNDARVKVESSEQDERLQLDQDMDSIAVRSFFEERYNSEDAASYLCPVQDDVDASNPGCFAPRSAGGGPTFLLGTAAGGVDSGSIPDPACMLSRPKYEARKAKAHLKCPFCEQVCNYNSQLVRHLRTHTGERPFPCAICGKYFKTRRHMEEHVLIHTGERPYLCNVCGKSFAHRFSWSRHMKSHSGKKSLWCVDCGKWFHGHVGFNKHMKVHREQEQKNTGVAQEDCGRQEAT